MQQDDQIILVCSIIGLEGAIIEQRAISRRNYSRDRCSEMLLVCRLLDWSCYWWSSTVGPHIQVSYSWIEFLIYWPASWLRLQSLQLTIRQHIQSLWLAADLRLQNLWLITWFRLQSIWLITLHKRQSLGLTLHFKF